MRESSEPLDACLCHHNRLLDWIVRAGGVESVACFIDGVAVTAAGGFPAVIVALCVGVVTERAVCIVVAFLGCKAVFKVGSESPWRASFMVDFVFRCRAKKPLFTGL
jgi:hypothetical protein